MKFIEEKAFTEKISICDISLVEFFQVVTNKKQLETPFTATEAKNIIISISEKTSYKKIYKNSFIYTYVFYSVEK